MTEIEKLVEECAGCWFNVLGSCRRFPKQWVAPFPPRQSPINKLHPQSTFLLTSPDQSSIIRDNQRNNQWEP